MFNGASDALIFIEYNDAAKVAKAVVDFIKESLKHPSLSLEHVEIIDFVWNGAREDYQSEALREAAKSPALPGIVEIASIVIAHHMSHFAPCDREAIDREMKIVENYFEGIQ